MDIRRQWQLLAELEPGLGEVRIFNTRRKHAGLTLRIPTELDVLHTLTDAHARLEHRHGILGRVRARRKDVNTVRRLVRTVDDEFVFTVTVKVHGQWPGPQADAEIHDETRVVILETLEATILGLPSRRLGPSGSLHGTGDNLGRVYDGMLRELTLPGIRNMHEPVGGLDDGRVAEFGLGLILEHQRGLPGDTVLTDRKIERAASLGGVIINQEMTSILQGHGISPGIRVRQVSEIYLRPG